MTEPFKGKVSKAKPKAMLQDRRLRRIERLTILHGKIRVKIGGIVSGFQVRGI